MGGEGRCATDRLFPNSAIFSNHEITKSYKISLNDSSFPMVGIVIATLCGESMFEARQEHRKGSHPLNHLCSANPRSPPFSRI